MATLSWSSAAAGVAVSVTSGSASANRLAASVACLMGGPPDTFLLSVRRGGHSTPRPPRGKASISAAAVFLARLGLARRGFRALPGIRYSAGGGDRQPGARQPDRPVLPRARQPGRAGADLGRQLRFAARERGDGAERHRARLEIGVARREDRAEDAVLDAGADRGDAVPAHEDDTVAAERTREGGTLFRLDHQHVGVAEFVVLVPVRRADAADCAEMEDRHVIGAG